MAKQKAIFKTDGSYQILFDHIRSAADVEMADRICREANKEYYCLLKKHTELGVTAASHWKQCCERAAIYLTVKKYYPETVMEWLDETLEDYGMKMGALLNRMLHKPGMKGLFLPIMRKMAKSVYGSKGGFQNQFGLVTSQETHFDILDCPYCRYLKELGCPELGPGFCKGDEYVYGNLDAFAFERSQTLATGGSKCDFCMRRK